MNESTTKHQQKQVYNNLLKESKIEPLSMVSHFSKDDRIREKLILACWSNKRPATIYIDWGMNDNTIIFDTSSSRVAVAL
jgi:hypothetical protein